ncbi:hypothetical protein LTR56_002328 [Elasticomyces elasticus]|nr:hypothetical protein LTR56_002328 [Elasticomyces elasticus]KAK3665892.1 hypothetical protein LTR22_003211 [Elasticomyces elasticus]KAK4929364.1 hypothetical protein LTR49_003968 [Elasticomyces elasticus]KAK5764653.1 hypothetical protein LTS12_005154 [Elasticomyces elasticus]
MVWLDEREVPASPYNALVVAGQGVVRALPRNRSPAASPGATIFASRCYKLADTFTMHFGVWPSRDLPSPEAYRKTLRLQELLSRRGPLMQGHLRRRYEREPDLGDCLIVLGSMLILAVKLGR